MHKRKPDFNPLKFTPKIIHNKLNINIDELVSYFNDDHTLNDCAVKFKCSEVTIKRRLRSVGVDTSKYNHSHIAVNRSLLKSPRLVPDDIELKRLYIDINMDSKSIADRYNVCYSSVRKFIHRLGLIKSRSKVAKSMSVRHRSIYGYAHPSQRPEVLSKTRKSTIKVKYIDIINREHTFRSLHELSYALFLDNLGLEWYYEEMRIPYVDMLTGSNRLYIIDFTVVKSTVVEWIEVKPAENMIPEDKRIYAERRAEETGTVYRGLTINERNDSKLLLNSGYRFDYITFLTQKPRCDQFKITYWFKNYNDANEFKLDGWIADKVVTDNFIYKKTFRRLK